MTQDRSARNTPERAPSNIREQRILLSVNWYRDFHTWQGRLIFPCAISFAKQLGTSDITPIWLPEFFARELGISIDDAAIGMADCINSGPVSTGHVPGQSTGHVRYEIRNLWEYQYDPNAARKQRETARKARWRNNKINNLDKCPVDCPGTVPGQSAQERRTKNVDHNPPLPPAVGHVTQSPPRPPPPPPPAPPSDGSACLAAEQLDSCVIFEKPKTDKSATNGKARKPDRRAATPEEEQALLQGFAHYRTYRSRAYRNPHHGMREWQLGLERLREGADAIDLCRAITGNFQDPHCCGENERRREYHELDLIWRSHSHLQKYIAVAERHMQIEKRRAERAPMAAVFTDEQRAEQRTIARAALGTWREEQRKLTEQKKFEQN